MASACFEGYHLAGVPYVPTAWDHVEYGSQATALGSLRVLEAIRVTSGITGSVSPEVGQYRSCSHRSGTR